MSPRPISLISGATSWLTETCVKPSSRAISASRASCVGMLPAVHQDDGERVDPASRIAAERLRAAVLVERDEHFAVDADALVDFDDPLVEHRRKHDVPREDVRPRLVSDPQRVAEAARDRQRDPLALALEQRVGGDGRAHPHFGELPAFLGEHPPDRLQRRVLILAGILRQQLLDPHPSVG